MARHASTFAFVLLVLLATQSAVCRAQFYRPATEHQITVDGPGGFKTYFCLVKNGGHAWPGRPQYMPEALIGKASQDFFASEMICKFFKDCPPRKLAATE